MRLKMYTVAKSWAYLLVPSSLGSVGIVWGNVASAVQVKRIYLPGAEDAIRGRIGRDYPLAREGSVESIGNLVSAMTAFLAGKPVSIGIDLLALDMCTPFQRRVLLAEHAIPRGWVSTYGRLAGHLGNPGAARAVGSALASNPFPLAIPCHRAVQSSGLLGGFQGGVGMKQALLEMEGVEFVGPNRVTMDRVYY